MPQPPLPALPAPRRSTRIIKRVLRLMVSPRLLLAAIARRLTRLRSRLVTPPAEPTLSYAELMALYEGLITRPRFSVLLLVCNTPAALLRQTLASVSQQVYQEWELCVVDMGSTRQETLRVLQEWRTREPQRLTSTRLPAPCAMSTARNAAARLAHGAFLAVLGQHDVLTPDALLQMALRLAQTPEADVLYADEDTLTMAGERVQPFYKPDFAPELLLSTNYFGHFLVIRASLFWHVGGFLDGVEGSEDFDLVLRLTEVTQHVEHLAHILSHARMVPASAAADPVAEDSSWRPASRQALARAVTRRGWQATVTNGLVPETYRVTFAVPPTARVTIIIPTKDRVDLLRVCIDSIHQRTTHPSYDILVISNNSTEEATYAYLTEAERTARLRWLRCDIPFNYAALNNFAVRHCDSPYLLLLNNDTEVINPEWLSSMLEFAQQPAIGAVGAKLLYPDNTVQHAGVILGLRGVAGHSYCGLPAHSHDARGQLQMIRNYSAVTAACLLTRRDVFEAVGGLNEDLAVAFNDVDFCLRVRQAGYRIVYTPYATLYHYESASRGDDEAVPEKRTRFYREITYMLSTWGTQLRHDPYYNPHLSLWRPDFSRTTAEDTAALQAFWRAFPLPYEEIAPS